MQPKSVPLVLTLLVNLDSRTFEKQCRLGLFIDLCCTMMTIYSLRLYIASIVLMLSSFYDFAVIVTLSANNKVPKVM